MSKIKIERALYLIDMTMYDVEALYQNYEENSSPILIEDFMMGIVRDLDVELIATTTLSSEKLVIGQAKILLNKTAIQLSVVGEWLPSVSRKNRLKYGDSKVGHLIEDRLVSTSNSRYKALKYMYSILQNFISVFEPNDTNSQKDAASAIKELTDTSKLSKIDKLLEKYSDTLTNKELMEVLRVGRNAIYTYRREGYLKPATVKYKKVCFLKSDIRNFLMSR